MSNLSLKYLAFMLCLSFLVNFGIAQNSFHGIAKYLLQVEGAADNKKDSMMIVFGNKKIKAVFYYRSENGEVLKNEFIDDFESNTSLMINPQKMTFSKSSMKSSNPFSFTNRHNFNYVLNNLCMLYSSDDVSVLNPDFKKAECLAGIDFLYDGIQDYFFYGVQPVVVDGRVVMDYKMIQKNGMIQKMELTDIHKTDDTEALFRLDGYTEEKNP